MHTSDRRRADERGQIIVLFALALVALIAMVGLVLDGGSAFAQRRSEQNAADLAAMAAANQYLVTGSKAAAIVTAETVAAQNGFAPSATTTVTVTFQDQDTEVKVDISSPHRNNFTSVIGMTTWQVSTTATVETGIPNKANGAPFIFNERAFVDGTGVPLPQYSDPNNPFAFGDTNNDVPTTATDIAWTCYGTCGNVDSSTVRSMVDGTSPVSTTLDPRDDFTEYIGQHNNGNHSTLYKEVEDWLIGEDVAVPIVDDNGIFQGWATFHVTGADQGGKKLMGYFVSPFQNSDLEVVGCTGTCPKPRFFGTYVLRLVN
jgi:Flp pilus assembly protein TadG